MDAEGMALSRDWDLEQGSGSVLGWSILHRDELGLQNIGCCRMAVGSPNTMGRAQGGQCPVCACWCCRGRNRTNPAPVCLQKTVYGANVIVFEGILAFANKELLKVSLPQVAAGLGGDVLQQDRHWPWVPL